MANKTIRGKRTADVMQSKVESQCWVKLYVNSYRIEYVYR